MKKSSIPKKDKRAKDDKEYEKPIVAKTAYDLQRLKLIKLMKNPEKPVMLPDRPKSKNSPSVPEFVRNVMGSSAGAGSGEFHVYRHLRRKEYSRQKFIQEKGRKETLDEEYHRKIQENREHAEQITSKKRAKRLKKKEKHKQAKKLKLVKNKEDKKEQSDDSEDDESSDDERQSRKMAGEINDFTKEIEDKNDTCTEMPGGNDEEKKEGVVRQPEESLRTVLHEKISEIDESSDPSRKKNTERCERKDDSSKIISDESQHSDTDSREVNVKHEEKKIDKNMEKPAEKVPDDNKVAEVGESRNSTGVEIREDIDDIQS